MRRISEHVYAEIYFWGCNPGFVTTGAGVFMIDTPQQPIEAVRWRERLLEHGPIRHLVNTEPHPDHIRGNAYFPGVEVIGQERMVARYEQMLPMMTGAQTLDVLKTADPDSVWLFNHPSYPPNPPTRTFGRKLRLQLGAQQIELLHHPGHTPPQTSVYVPADGVVFTGDNVFHQCKTFLQEADPWEWLAALESIAALDVHTIVPGHGEPCDRTYLVEQAQIIHNWIGVIEQYVHRGLTEDEAVAQPLDVARDIDPYPIGQRLFPMSDNVTERNIRNVYKQVLARQGVLSGT
ncbi:MAG TPA: MBL fold metallo-hydrolase [Chloroflexota bacterium]|nr:MBL fold metallo-hydrolase [Chloroflexota bacterium]